jgi:membrane protein YqaA with SNARE-associated domain
MAPHFNWWQIGLSAAAQAAKSGASKKTAVSTSLHLVRQFGGLALVPLGVLDSSIIPTFGSLDLLTAWLAAHDPKLWWYYALMSTAGSLIGAILMYRLGKKMGALWIEKKIGAKRLHKIRNAVEHHGFGAIFVSTIAPPPFPTSWFFVVAGTFSVPRKSFTAATIAGRLLRYGLLTLVAAHYGRHFLRYLRHPLHYALISIMVTASLIVAAYLFGRHREGLAAKVPKAAKV